MTDYAPVPRFVLDRWPGLDPMKPETTPEPDRCVTGRPWGMEPYGGLYADTEPHLYEQRWRRYLEWFDAGAKKGWAAPCLRRATREPEHMCGNHSNSYRRQTAAAARHREVDAALDRNLDLAKQLVALGVTADGWSDTVRLPPEAAEDLIDRLTADRHAFADLLGAAEALLRPGVSAGPGLRDAVARTRRHLDRVEGRTGDRLD